MEGEVDAERDQQVVVLFEAFFEDEFVDLLVAVDDPVVAKIGEEFVSLGREQHLCCQDLELIGQYESIL